ncbi:hypothetical protein ACJ73_08952 [Blastomyces percursus]|uniref:Uncharacterized protein n=1 Tax=Blastomyces percursus TaxID=1658174 RepID=A0A1J9PH44_9EURO|nr:hypothetical protein ACJ73_08952 [Blastomyces percursus]
MTVRCLVSYQLALYEQLDFAQHQIDQGRTELLEFTNRCEALQERIYRLEGDCGMLRIALDQAREGETTAKEDFASERKRRAAIEAALHMEIRTLWKLVDEIRPVQSNTGQLATVQQLFQGCKEQQQTIDILKATVEHYKAIIQSSADPSNEDTEELDREDWNRTSKA